MPSPKSILADIHDRGLSHEVAHRAVDSTGRIRGASVAVDDVSQEEPLPRNALVTLDELPSDPPAHESNENEETVAVEQSKLGVKKSQTQQKSGKRARGSE